MSDSPVLARGRDSEILDPGDGTVVRRTLKGRDQTVEARTMEYARQAGCPVPRVLDVRDGGRELVMERVDGPTMADHLARRPWRVRHHGRVLARLHEQVHAVAGPDWLPATGDGGDRLVHLDLHPLNVLITAAGPVLIDWTNAAVGEPATDHAKTWLLMAVPEAEVGGVPRWVVTAMRRVMVRAFLAAVDITAARARLPLAADYVRADPNITPAEKAALERFLETEIGRR